MGYHEHSGAGVRYTSLRVTGVSVHIIHVRAVDEQYMFFRVAELLDLSVADVRDTSLIVANVWDTSLRVADLWDSLLSIVMSSWPQSPSFPQKLESTYLFLQGQRQLL